MIKEIGWMISQKEKYGRNNLIDLKKKGNPVEVTSMEK